MLSWCNSIGPSNEEVSFGFKFPTIDNLNKLDPLVSKDEVVKHLNDNLNKLDPLVSKEDVVKHLNDNGYNVNHDELDGKAARFVAAWNTESTDVDKLLKTIAKK